MHAYEGRLFLLKEFTKQLILNSRNEEKIFVPHLKIPETAEFIPKKETEKTEPLIKQFVKPFVPLVQIKNIEKQETPILIQQTPLEEIKPEEFIPGLSEKPIPGKELEKINFLISDPRVTVIECPGPDRFSLARSSGITSMTKIILSRGEISSIIERFSRESRIPVISGLFKAAVGNLVITAVISELVGSRFIITKITPRFIIEQAGMKKPYYTQRL